MSFAGEENFPGTEPEKVEELILRDNLGDLFEHHFYDCAIINNDYDSNQPLRTLLGGIMRFEDGRFEDISISRSGPNPRAVYEVAYLNKKYLITTEATVASHDHDRRAFLSELREIKGYVTGGITTYSLAASERLVERQRQIERMARKRWPFGRGKKS